MSGLQMDDKSLLQVKQRFAHRSEVRFMAGPAADFKSGKAAALNFLKG
jgi:hypothetical protein